MKRRVEELIGDWDDELFDNPLDAGQEAQELLAVIPHASPQRPDVERVLREVQDVLKGKPAATRGSARRVPRASTKGADFMATLHEGGPLATYLRPTDDSFFVSQVTTVVRALTRDDTGAWAKGQLRSWPRDVPFTRQQLANWNAGVLRPRVIEHSAGLAALASQLPRAAFQVREELVEALADLVVREGATSHFTAPAMKRALTKWTDGAALLRLTLHFRHRATTNQGPVAANYALLARVLEATVPAALKKLG